MPDIISTIWDVGKGLFGLRGELEKARRDRRDRAAQYFSDLGSLIETTSASLKVRIYPHGSCAQLEQLALLMPKTLKGLLDEKDIEKYQQKLLKVWEIEQLFGQLHSVPKRSIPKKLEKLDEAAGYFRALAAHLRVVGSG
jgi:hypothetical protein